MKKPVAVKLKVGLLLSLCLFSSSSSSAQTLSPFQFLRVNYSARTAALGDATVAAMEDPSSIALNPAAVYTSASGKLSATFVKHVMDINSGMASYVSDIGTAKWAAFASYSSFGSFVAKNANGDPTGQTLTAGSVAIGGVYSNEIDSGFYYGVGLNFVNTSLADVSTSALTVNAGLLYHVPNSRWNVGLSLLNVGVQLSKIADVSEPLPTDLRVGVNHRLRGLPLLVNFSFNHLAEQNEALFDHFKNFSLGGELYLGKIIELRLGYNNTTRNASSFPVSSRLAGVSFGLGLKLKQIGIDYAMSSLVSGVLIHRFSVQTTL